MKITVRDLVLTAFLIAIIYVATAFIRIDILGSLAHIGTATLTAMAIAFGKNKAAIAGSFGMTIFNLLNGLAVFAPFTFVIMIIVGYLIGHITAKNDSIVRQIIATALAGVIMLILRYFTWFLIFPGDRVGAYNTFIANGIQFGLMLFVGIPFGKILKIIKIRIENNRI